MTKLTDLARVVDVGLNIVTHRFLTLLALTMSFGLFCWAMTLGTWPSIIVAGGFGALIFLPILAVDRRPEAKWQAEPEE